MQRDEFLNQIESLQTRVSELKQRVRQSDAQTMTGETLGELKTALEEITVLEDRLVERSREIAAAREHAEAERAHYQEHFEFAPDGYLITDRRGVILEANEAAADLLGLPKAYVVGKPLGYFIVREDLKRFLKDAARAQTGGVRDIATRLRREQGDTFDVLITLTAADKNCVRWIIRNITEFKRAEAKARSSERLSTMGATALLLAQEISNPLNDIYTTVQQLGRTVANDGADQEGPLNSTLQELSGEIRRLRGLVQRFCSFSTAREANVHLVNVADILRDVLAREISSWAERGILVEQNLLGEMNIQADYERLKQAFGSLCKNAAEAMPHGGKLIVQGYATDNEVTLHFIDTGMGVPKGIDIFDLFSTTKFQAMGVGLPIAQQIIADHGGTISYTTMPGKTVFRVKVPAKLPGVNKS